MVKDAKVTYVYKKQNDALGDGIFCIYQYI